VCVDIHGHFYPAMPEHLLNDPQADGTAGHPISVSFKWWMSVLVEWNSCNAAMDGGVLVDVAGTDQRRQRSGVSGSDPAPGP
jgi:hypothetical protein